MSVCVCVQMYEYDCVRGSVYMIVCVSVFMCVSEFGYVCECVCL